MGPSARVGLQERIETSALGQSVISGLVLLTLVAIVATNLPESHLRKALMKPAQPYLNATGLDQNWGVFAPDPRREVFGLQLRLNYSSGPLETWQPPDRDPVIGTYSDYRWRKFMENTLANGGNEVLADQLARWVVEHERRRPERPATVAVVKRTAPLPPPGPQAKRPLNFNEATFHTYRVPAPGLPPDK